MAQAQQQAFAGAVGTQHQGQFPRLQGKGEILDQPPTTGREIQPRHPQGQHRIHPGAMTTVKKTEQLRPPSG